MKLEALIEYVRYLEAKIASLEDKVHGDGPVEGYVYVNGKGASVFRHGDDGSGCVACDLYSERRQRQEEINQQRNNGNARARLESARAEVKARFDREGRTIESGQISAADIEKAAREILRFLESRIDTDRGRIRIHEFDVGNTHCEIFVTGGWDSGPTLKLGIECNF